MKGLRIIYSKNPVFDKCPDCGEIAMLHRSRARSFLEKTIKKLTFWKIYRCRGCGWRGYRSTLTIKTASFTSILVYIILFLLTAAIVRIVISKFIK